MHKAAAAAGRHAPAAAPKRGGAIPWNVLATKRCGIYGAYLRELAIGTTTRIMASRPDILDELPWLRQAKRNARKAQWLRHGRSALLLGALAAPALMAKGRFGWTSGVPGSSGEPSGPATPAVIDTPFAPKAMQIGRAHV